MYGKPLRKSAEPAIDRLKPSPFKHIKKRVTFVTLFLIVVKVTILEPFDKNIVSDKTVESTTGMSVYTELVRIMKESTTAYYNMRLALGFNCS